MFPRIQLHDAWNFHSITQFLQHCSLTKNLRPIQIFHAHLLRAGLFFVSPNLQTKLICTYTTCLDRNSIKTLAYFLKCLNPKNPLPFNSIISHFSQHGYNCFALHTLSFMHSNGVFVDSYAFCCALKSISCLENVFLAKLMHSYIEKSGWLASVFVGSALVDFYARMSCIDDATMVFDEIPMKNTVCVNALLSGYAGAKMWDQGVKLVRGMQLLGLEADNFTFSAALQSCTGLYDVELGKQIHGIVMRKVIEFRTDVFLQSLLIEMYGKCGLLESAKNVFDMVGYREGEEMRRDVILWTSILGVHGKNGNYGEVVRLFNSMLNEGIKPDGVAFLSVISACAHTGQVDLGMKFFESMTLNYGLSAGQEHYSCLVDLLCRAGELERACKLVNDVSNTGYESCTVSLWGALLSACTERGNVKLGKAAAQRALDLEPGNVGIYVLLSNMYAKNGMWDEIEQLRELMQRRGLKKDIGWSLIDVVT
ncbi:putative pentatricopeptide repeat-containing protein At3g23330 [Primulina tabacum]|uniref:putative pentatricopeptide repeat-containing protein At3g23330 n=1 Tax=Primulina tabacum TaxID=48773 RepID=UPI003F5A2C6B